MTYLALWPLVVPLYAIVALLVMVFTDPTGDDCG